MAETQKDNSELEDERRRTGEQCEKLREKLEALKKEGIVPDVLTFAGNGEPTLHPDFPDIVKEVIRVRDAFCPSAKISILSNSTRVTDEKVREA